MDVIIGGNMRKALLLVLLLTSVLVWGKNIEEAKARIVAKNIFNERLLTSDQVIDNESISRADWKSDQLYIFNLTANNGFVIISSDDATYPVLAYSDMGLFNSDNVPPALAKLLDDYDDQLSLIKENNYQASSQIQEEWADLSSNNYLPNRQRTSVGPLIKSLWNQCQYYNTMCPEDENGVDGHVPVGCVATAMVQIMHYYKFPAQGQGESSYWADGYGQQSANYGQATYNWDNMPNYLTDYNEDLQLISYHAGVSLEMMYGPSGSGSYTPYVTYALQEYFKYDSSIYYHHREDYTNEEWIQKLKDELDALRPLEYSGTNDISGHAFVCDGYQDDMFHFNWGWDGNYNGYYQMNNLNPRMTHYNYNQGAVFNIFPGELPDVDFVASHTNVQTGASVDFTNLVPLATAYDEWTWSFAGGSPNSSNEVNPQNIVYNAPGTYLVSLMLTHNSNFALENKQAYITVSDNFNPISAFTLLDTVFAIGEDISIQNNSLNLVDSYEWTFDTEDVSFAESYNATSISPIISFAGPGKHIISLTCNYNGVSSTSHKTVHIGGYSMPYQENFELPAGLRDWTVENPENNYTWDGCYFAGGMTTGAKCMYIKLSSETNSGERDGLISPLLNFSNCLEVNLSFKHAYGSVMSSSDSLIIYIKRDEDLLWQRIYASSDLSTSDIMDPNFVPTSPEDWANNVNVDLTDWAGETSLRLKFESYNNLASRIYLDDINIAATLITDNAEDDISPFNGNLLVNKNYPNPFNPQTTISFDLKNREDVEVSIYNLKGQLVKTLLNKRLASGNHKLVWNGRNSNNEVVASGLYLYRIKTDSQSVNKKMILMK